MNHLPAQPDPESATGTEGPAPQPAAVRDDITLQLQAWQGGDPGAFERVVHCMHADFMRMAAGRLSGYDELSLSTGDVLHESILRLMDSGTTWQNRSHFFATVSLTMRSVLREYARAKLADKRSGERVEMTLSSVEQAEPSMAAELLTLDRLLDELAARDPRGAEVLQLTYFAGLKRTDIALALGISVPTVDRELRFARAWLSEQLGRDVGA